MYCINIDNIFNRLKRHTISSKLVAGVLVHNVLIIHFSKVSFHLLSMGTSERSSGCLWYKWVILVFGCTSQFLRSTFLYGTLPVLSLFYEAEFSDRQLSSMIGTIQTSLSYGAGRISLMFSLVTMVVGPTAIHVQSDVKTEKSK